MALEERLDITPPEWSISNISGKLNPFCQVVLVTSVLRDGVPIMQKNHRAQLDIQPDGSWDWSTIPLMPGTTTPFDVTADMMARTRAVIATTVAQRGVIDHTLPDGAVVSYANDEDGTYRRVVTPPSP